MIIELRKYNEIGELLIENRTTGSQAQVSYWDMVREAPVTRAAVCMGVKEMGCEQGTGAHAIGSSQDPDQGRVWALQNN